MRLETYTVTLEVDRDHPRVGPAYDLDVILRAMIGVDCPEIRVVSVERSLD